MNINYSGKKGSHDGGLTAVILLFANLQRKLAARFGQLLVLLRWGRLNERQVEHAVQAADHLLRLLLKRRLHRYANTRGPSKTILRSIKCSVT
jgi:hypothetical protein